MTDNQTPINTPEIQESATTQIETKSQPKKKVSYILGIVIIIVLVVGLAAVYLLSQQSQDVRQQASACNEECPGSDGVLRNCTPPESDGSPEESICNSAVVGRVEYCGGVKYCCNGNGWTTNMTACTPSPTPTPSPSPSPTPSPTPSPSPSPSPSPTPSPTPTPTPSPSPSPTPTSEASPSPTPITYSCNSTCSSNSQCQTANSSYICYQGQCRLDSNPTSDQCAQSSSTATQPELPAELPASGSEDILNWFKAGLGVLGIGTILLLLL